MTDLDVDVAVLGAGFGGSLTALLLEQIGLEVAAVERATHPRFAIGESSTPTANMILRDLADRYGVEELRPLASYGPWQETYPEVVAGRKRGFSYFRHRPDEPFEPAPDHADELLVAASSDPYRSDTHWLRADVDAFLARRARDAGAFVLEGTEVEDLRRRDERWRARARGPGGPVGLRADFVVDATGGGAGLLPPSGLDRDTGSSPEEGREPAGEDGGPYHTRTRALYAHFRGLPRWEETVKERGGSTEDHPFPCDEAALHHVLDGGWLWELRFNDGRVSAGLVLDLGRHHGGPTASAGEEWREQLAPYPTLARRFAGAELVDPPGRIVRTGRLQRSTDRAAGPGWAMLPSAAGFVDPLHSTGIAHTMSGVERLIGLLGKHGPRPPTPALLEYGRSVRRELEFVDRLVAPCYEALPSFRGWVAATKLYFTAATRYERLRHRGSVEPNVGTPDHPAFLCSDDRGLHRIAEATRKRVAKWPSGDAPTPGRVDALERDLREALEPYDEVGLFGPDVPRMHPHAAAPTPEFDAGPGNPRGPDGSARRR